MERFADLRPHLLSPEDRHEVEVEREPAGLLSHPEEPVLPFADPLGIFVCPGGAIRMPLGTSSGDSLMMLAVVLAGRAGGSWERSHVQAARQGGALT